MSRLKLKALKQPCLMLKMRLRLGLASLAVSPLQVLSKCGNTRLAPEPLFPCILFLSCDVPLSKSDFPLRSKSFVNFPVDIFRAGKNSNSQRYTSKQELMDF